nr:RecName: Full=Alpha-amylase; AltName: Full=1,4-alpha-D-glucan glucanohydrolase [Bacillus sp. (in: firmicutes)]
AHQLPMGTLCNFYEWYRRDD